MYVKDLGEAPPPVSWTGLVSHILLEEGDAPGGEMSITWVDVEPGKRATGSTATVRSRST